MKKPFSKSSSKSEKGQVLVVVALTIIALVAIIGLAVDTGYMYLRYSYLNRAVDAAALAGSGEFKNYNDDNLRDSYIRAAAWQLISLNEITPDPGAPFSDPVTGVPGFSVETCNQNNGDAVVVAKLCDTNPLQKIVRVTVQEKVPTFFLAVLGFTTVPISISSYSIAASLDAMLVLDTSASMRDETDPIYGGSPTDPTVCNPINQCEPMKQVKAGAAAFSNQLYYPYDNLGLVGFDSEATVYLPLADNNAAVQAAIASLQVYDGTPSLITDGTSPTRCIYYADYKNVDPFDHTYDTYNGNPYRTYGEDISNPGPFQGSSPILFWDWGTPDYDERPPRPSYPDDPNNNYGVQAEGLCRLYNIPPADGGTFVNFDCPMLYGLDPDPSNCGNTNLHDAIRSAGNELKTYGRDTSVWALVLLSDGIATRASWPTGSLAPFTAGQPICPDSLHSSQTCHDSLPKVRHCLSLLDYTAIGYAAGYATCMDPNNYPVDGGGTPLGTVSENRTNYDVDDAARDAFDLVASNNTLVFTIGLGPNIPYPAVEDAVEPGETLLNYGASVGNGTYLAAQSSSDLTSIFLQIAKLIVSRINQ